MKARLVPRRNLSVAIIYKGSGTFLGAFDCDELAALEVAAIEARRRLGVLIAEQERQKQA